MSYSTAPVLFDIKYQTREARCRRIFGRLSQGLTDNDLEIMRSINPAKRLAILGPLLQPLGSRHRSLCTTSASASGPSAL